MKINTFILGSPKCGTTALYELLNSHEDVFFPSSMKEPHFFADDLEKYKAHNTYEDFIAIYDAYNSEKIIGDASIFNMYSESAIDNIKKYNPNAKIIIMMRNPVEAVPSFHSQVVFTQDENISDVSEAWDMSEFRRVGKYVPKQCRCGKILDYKKMYSYATQLEKVYSNFSKAQVLVILHDEFKTDYKKTMKLLFDFLDIEHCDIENKNINPNTVNKINFISKFLRHPPSFVRKIKRIILGRGRTKLYDALILANTKVVKRDNISVHLKNEIKNNYSNEIDRLAFLLGRDIHEWK